MFTGRYLPGVYAGAIGILILFGINALSIPKGVETASRRDEYRATVALEKERIQSSAQIEQERARQARANADIYRDNQVNRLETLVVMGYIDNPNEPPNLDSRLFTDPKEKTWIFDSANACIGFWNRGNFFWKNSKGNESICDGMKN